MVSEKLVDGTGQEVFRDAAGHYFHRGESTDVLNCPCGGRRAVVMEFSGPRFQFRCDGCSDSGFFVPGDKGVGLPRGPLRIPPGYKVEQR